MATSRYKAERLTENIKKYILDSIEQAGVDRKDVSVVVHIKIEESVAMTLEDDD